MISHQPEVSRLLHQDRVQRLADAAQRPMRHPHLRSPRIAGKLSGLPVLARAALDVRHRRLRTRPWATSHCRSGTWYLRSRYQVPILRAS